MGTNKIPGDPRAEARGLDILVGKNIQKYRVKKNLTQKQLGNRLGLTFQQIQKYENATNRVSAPRLFMIAQTLEVPVICFFDDNGFKKPNPIDVSMLSPEAVELAINYDRIGKARVKKALEVILDDLKP
ncbi:MAG: helix-turn-helix transcriptional regulator [Sphingomonadales bacterium]